MAYQVGPWRCHIGSMGVVVRSAGTSSRQPCGRPYGRVFSVASQRLVMSIARLSPTRSLIGDILKNSGVRAIPELTGCCWPTEALVGSVFIVSVDCSHCFTPGPLFLAAICFFLSHCYLLDESDGLRRVMASPQSNK